MSAQQTTLVLRKDIFQDCLVLYPQETWNAETAKLRSRLNRWDKLQQQLLRQFVVDAEQVEMDANGRILIPKRYLEMAKISTEVRFIGVDNTIEIWNNSSLEEALLPPEDFGAMLEKLMVDNKESGEK